MAKSLFFFADGTLGEEPYLTTTDGSDADRLADIAPGNFDSVDDDFVAVVGNKVLFAADNEGATNDSGEELWSYDADTGVTSLLRDIEFGPNDSDPDYLVSAGNFAFFQAYTTDFGQELWVSDGTSTGTKRLTDINPNNGNGLNGWEIAKFGDKALFIGDDGVSGFEELWISDGDEFGTQELVGVAQFANFADFMFDPIVERYGALDSSSFYFQAESNLLGRELWKTDGTSAGTVEIKDINPTGDSDPYNFMALNGRMYFVADNGVDGRELWRSDGTEGGTTIVKDINVAGAGFDSDPEDFKLLKTSTGDKLIFSADDGVNGRELWITDGTNAGTTLVLDINGNSNDSLEFADFNEDTYFAVVGDGSKAVFSADDDNVDEELWITDGTTGGTMLLKEIDIDDSRDSDPEDFFEGGNGLAYFSADVDGEVPGQVPTGRELWVTDGTEDGTTLVANIQNGDNDSNPFPRANVDVNGPPTEPALSSMTVAENTDDGETIGTLSSTDSENDAITYSITSDSDDKFDINGSNLIVDGDLDFETKASHSVTVEASDGNGGSASATFSIAVTDVNESPSTPTLGGSSIAENSAVATVVGALSSTDPDAGDTVSYSMTSDAGGKFAVDGDNIVVNGSLDFETDETHSVTVEATDGNGGTSTGTFTINVTDVEENPATDGPDVFVGTDANDTYDGLKGADDISGEGGDDTLKGNKGADLVKGGQGNDSVYGNKGFDEVKGGGGQDHLYGGKGKDDLTGGGDIDTFHFEGKTGKDTISDFKIGTDIIAVLGEGLSFSDLKIKSKNGGDDTKIQFGGGDKVILEDISSDDVTSTMFELGIA